MKFTVRDAAATDAAEIWKMIRELAEFENAPDEHERTEDELRNDLIQRKFICFMAESESRHIAGMALCYPSYSTWKGPKLYLDDIVVKSEFRGQGCGSVLFRHLLSYAQTHKFAALHWQVLNWNTPAIGFYEKAGADISAEWLNGSIKSTDFTAAQQRLTDK